MHFYTKVKKQKAGVTDIKTLRLVLVTGVVGTKTLRLVLVTGVDASVTFNLGWLV